MQVGLFCSSNKPHLWGGLIKTLSNNSVDWNLCIAGPNPPTEPLPGNVKFIQTNVKPAQCCFIASQNVVGDYIATVTDDIILSPGCIDDLYKLVDNKMTISSPSFVLGGEKIDHHMFVDPRGYNASDPRSTSQDKNIRRKFITLNFPLPLLMFMHRDTFNDIGIDKHFVALYWVEDIAFELVSKGGKVIISDTGNLSDFKGGGICLSRITCD